MVFIRMPAEVRKVVLSSNRTPSRISDSRDCKIVFCLVLSLGSELKITLHPANYLQKTVFSSASCAFGVDRITFVEKMLAQIACRLIRNRPDICPIPIDCSRLVMCTSVRLPLSVSSIGVSTRSPSYRMLSNVSPKFTGAERSGAGGITGITDCGFASAFASASTAGRAVKVDEPSPIVVSRSSPRDRSMAS